MKYAAGSGAMIFIPSFMKTDSGLQKLIGGIHGHTDRIEIALSPLLFCQNKESRLKNHYPFLGNIFVQIVHAPRCPKIGPKSFPVPLLTLSLHIIF
jgi:hypothetical protein